MASNISSIESNILNQKDLKKEKSLATMKMRNDENDIWNKSEMYTKNKGWFKTELMWFNVVAINLFHLYFVYALFTFDFLKNMRTTAWILYMYQLAGFGVVCGAHRLWTHRAYKGKWLLRVLLAIGYVSSGVNNLYIWVRDHRLHHKYTDTDADPHNSNRGFYFCHVGWLMMKKHPEVIRRSPEIDMSDLLADPVAAFVCKHFAILKLIFAFILPVMVPVYGWNETWSRAIVSQIVIRYIIFLNLMWSVNSAAHFWGSKPYNAHIKPTDNRVVAFLAGGEGWHNYHHVFPWDYKAAELGNYELNTITMYLDFFSMIGWAYDLKQPSKELVKAVMMKRGSGKGNSRDRTWNPPTDDSTIFTRSHALP